MKLSIAREIGKECGLESDAECVNNILIHAMNMFEYSKIEEEEAELITDARNHGVRFSHVCGDAVLNGDRDEDLCYMCQGLNNVVGDN